MDKKLKNICFNDEINRIGFIPFIKKYYQEKKNYFDSIRIHYNWKFIDYSQKQNSQNDFICIINNIINWYSYMIPRWKNFDRLPKVIN